MQAWKGADSMTIVLGTLKWVVTVLLVPMTLITAFFVLTSVPNLVWTVMGRHVGTERASRRTARAKGIVDGSSLVLLPGNMRVAHATWQDDGGACHAAIGPVVSDVRRAGDGKTGFDGTVLRVSDDDWKTILRHRRKARQGGWLHDGIYAFRQDPPEMKVARGNPWMVPELGPYRDDDPLWAGLPLASLAPCGSEVEVAYDPVLPDDAKIICDGGTDGTFVGRREIAVELISLLYSTGLCIAEISVLLAMHGGWTTGWQVALVTGLACLSIVGIRQWLFPIG